jgi:hypothetical protein
MVYNLTEGRVKQTNFKMKKSLFTAFAVGLGLTANLWAQVPSYVPSNGLVGWWPFTGNANDESGNGNNGNGTVNGATLDADRFSILNNAYNFVPQSSNHIEIVNSTSLNPSSGISINTWIKLDSYIDNQVLVSKGFTSQSLPYISYTLKMGEPGFNSKAEFQLSINGTRHLLRTNLSIPLSNWVLITGTYDGNSMKIFVNGVMDNSLNISGLISSYNTNLNLGRWAPGVPNNPCYLNGSLDDIGIWNRALTQQEISDLYNSNNCSNSLAISPTLNTQNIGGNATFTATSSDSNPTFIWQSDLGQGFQTLNNYGNYSGANTNTLTISNVQLANHNQPIRAISTSGNCVDTSNIATIQIADTCITNVTVYDTLLTAVTDTLIINTTLSLPAPNNENTILIYPNPASDHITIDNGNYTAMAGYSIKITNNAGQQVFQSAINQQQFYVDLSTWNGNGLYFVHLIDPQNNTLTVRKIVLQ